MNSKGSQPAWWLVLPRHSQLFRLRVGFTQDLLRPSENGGVEGRLEGVTYTPGNTMIAQWVWEEFSEGRNPEVWVQKTIMVEIKLGSWFYCCQIIFLPLFDKWFRPFHYLQVWLLLAVIEVISCFKKLFIRKFHLYPEVEKIEKQNPMTDTSHQLRTTFHH